MRIFTLGKNGIPLFFFAFILFSGTYSTYGQEACPIVTDSTQIFCDAEEAEIGDLQVTGDDVAWYADAALTQRLSNTQLLDDNATYYASNEAGTCPAMEVTADIVYMPEILGVKQESQPQAEAQKQSLSTIGLCVADVENPGVYVEDLRTDAPTDEVQWYFGSTEANAVEVSLSDELQNGTYWVERIVNKHDGTICTTNKRRTNVVLSSEDAPEGPNQQVFCESENATLADLEASGTNRYYSSMDSDTRLSENTLLVDGTTYYVSSFGEVCESFDRLAVTVTVNSLDVTEDTQTFCSSQSEGNDLGVASVGDLSPEGGVWYADSNFTEPLPQDEELVDGEDYFLEVDEQNCTTTRVVVTVNESPNAGSTSAESFCENEGEVDLYPYINHSVLGAPDTTGSFNHSAFTGTVFNTEDLEPGTYSLTYTVTNEACGTDTSSFTLTIQDAPDAGDPINETICSSELSDSQALAAEFSSYLEGRDQGGTFDVSDTPEVEAYGVFELYQAFQEAVAEDPTAPFSAVYNVSNENCTDSAEMTVQVLQSPEAGNGGEIQLQENTPNTVSLSEANEGNSDPGGVWTNENGNTVTGDFVPQEPGAYTYTVEFENGCTATATVTVLDVPQDCPVVENPEQEFCESIGEGNNFDRPRVQNLEPSDATWYTSADSQDALSPDTLLEDDTVYYAGNEAGDCENRASVTVNIFPTPNAGSTSQMSFCENEAAVNLVDYIEDSQLGPPQQTGYFTPALENNMFDPAEWGPGTYSFTYTVPGNEDCDTDTSRSTVTVLEAPDAGEPVNEEFCISSDDELPTEEEFLALFGEDSRDDSGVFEPTLEQLANDYAENPYRTFETTFTVENGNCTDTAELSVTFNEEVPANAGGDVEASICSTAGVVQLSSFLGEDAVQGGSYSAPYEDGTFDPSTAETDQVVITYTVSEDEDCVTGESSATITLNIEEGPDAGNDGEITLNVTDEPVNLFDSLEGTPEEGGVWTPGDENGNLDPSTLTEGVYDYTYTVTNENNCEATAVVTVTIEGEIICPEVTETEQAFCESILSGNDSRLPTVSDLLPSGATWYPTADATEALPADTALEDGATYFAGNSNGTCDARESVTVTLDDSPNAGKTSQATFCANGEAVDLLDHMEPSILGAPDTGGTFSPALASGTTVFDPSVDAAGTYTYTVESNNDACPSDSAVITITLTPEANAGAPYTVEFCTTQGIQDLTETLPEDADNNGSFEGLEDNMFDPSAYEPGSYEFTYRVESEGNCESSDETVVTVVVSEAPEAPAATPLDFCISDNATVADLSANTPGDNLLWYTDEALEELADEADALVEATYYVTQTNEGGCESEATPVDVTLTDAPTPTLNPGGNVFCEFDNPTIADLRANVAEDGTIIWYDAETEGNTLNSSDLLQNGATYYAALVDPEASACESSVRLAVTVTLETCEVVIPDAFSPNGDGINDTFQIDNLAAEYPNYTIEIFNRWGNIVFQGNASTPSWDGVSTESRSLGDQVLPVGVYFYIVNYNDGQTAPTQGRLYLSR